MNMLHDSWWISTIDHRVSTALVFFLLLLTMGNGHKKPYFPLRILVSFIALCAVSWLTRYWIDILPDNNRRAGHRVQPAPVGHEPALLGRV